MDEAKQLVRFAETAKGLEPLQRLKLILFATGAKQNTHVILKTNAKNLEEKEHFEQHLQHNKTIFEVSRPKSYEEIKKIQGNKIVWEMKGIWQGYDLFKTKKEQKEFHHYKKLLSQQKHFAADKIAGKLYGYPKCCTTEYTKQHDTKYLKNKYTYCEFYTQMHEQHKKFPFIAHYPCSTKCKATQKLNKKYAFVVKKNAPLFWKEYTAKQKITTDIIIDAESDIFDKNGKSIWQKKDCHEYSAITAEQIYGHHYLLSVLTKTLLLKGTRALVEIKIQHDYADVKLLFLKDFNEEIHHERKFLVRE